MQEALLLLSIIIAFIYWLVGISRSWQSAFWMNVICSTSYVIAFQNINFISRLIADNSLIYGLSGYANEALSFLVIFFLSIVIITVLYNLLWSSKVQKKTKKESGLMKFFQVVLTAVIGWGIVLMLTIAFFVFNYEYSGGGDMQIYGIGSFLQTSIDIMIRIGQSMSVNGIPSFFVPWLTGLS